MQLTQLMQLVVFLVNEWINSELLMSRFLIVIDLVECMEILIQQGLYLHVHFLCSSKYSLILVLTIYIVY